MIHIAASERRSAQLIAATGLPVAGYEVVGVYPHDPEAFTQGLCFSEGRLFESTGWEGRSSVREVRPEDGKVLRRVDIPHPFFGEGLVCWQDQIISLSWRDGVGFRWHRDTFALIDCFAYPWEGWGITANDDHLIVSDGTSTLRFLEPATMTECRSVTVQAFGRTIPFLNDLHWVQGDLWANVFHTDLIARIDAARGEVVGWIDLTGLRRQACAGGSEEYLNGLTTRPDAGTWLVTGKHWPTLFELAVESQPAAI